LGVPDAPQKSIIHLDLDSFYASVEVLDNPSLAGRPVIVGGSSVRGVVSTASYEARAFGVHSGMPSGQARALCPHAVFLGVRMERYRELSQRVMEVFRRYTPLVEPLALDEAFLDVTMSRRLFGPAEMIARRIKGEVRGETGLTISAGVASQKHIAKIASGLGKPDALTVVPPGGELDFLWPMDIGKLWGAGKAAAGRLNSLGFRTIGDLAKAPEGWVASRLGEAGRGLWMLANGRDSREVVPGREAKSIGAEETYGTDISGAGAVRRELLALSVKVSSRLRGAGVSGSTLTVKMRDPSFRTFTRSRTVDQPLEDHLPVYALALELSEGREGPFRLLGLQASGLQPRGAEPPPVRRTLFGGGQGLSLPPGNPRLSEAMDLIHAKFGPGRLKPAALLDPQPGKGGKKPE
jgi:DNA polymerase-4